MIGGESEDDENYDNAVHRPIFHLNPADPSQDRRTVADRSPSADRSAKSTLWLTVPITFGGVIGGFVAYRLPGTQQAFCSLQRLLLESWSRAGACHVTWVT